MMASAELKKNGLAECAVSHKEAKKLLTQLLGGRTECFVVPFTDSEGKLRAIYVSVDAKDREAL
jgi:hypothetical protein